MRGTDVTIEQLAHAEAFLRAAQVPKPISGEKTMMEHASRFGVTLPELIRLLAWYGAIRAKSGNVAGVGKLTKIRKDETGA